MKKLIIMKIAMVLFVFLFKSSTTYAVQKVVSKVWSGTPTIKKQTEHKTTYYCPGDGVCVLFYDDGTWDLNLPGSIMSVFPDQMTLLDVNGNPISLEEALENPDLVFFFEVSN